MNKKAFIASIAILIVIIIGISSIFIYNKYIKSERIICEPKIPDSYLNKDNQRIIKVNDKLYYDTGKESEIEARCGNKDGKIESNIESDYIPLANNQSNFKGYYEYQYGLYGTIDVVIDKKWITFKPLNQSIDFLDENFKIEIVKNSNKNIKGEEYYSNSENQKIYLIETEEIYLIDSNNKITLKDFILKENLTIDQSINYITNKLEHTGSLYDGGTTIYRDGGTTSSKYKESKISNTGFTIVKCYKGNNDFSNYNTDVYIGPKDLKVDLGFEKGYCRYEN